MFRTCLYFILVFALLAGCQTTEKQQLPEQTNKQKIQALLSALQSDSLTVNKVDMPRLVGGMRALNRNIEYPERARQSGIEGTVVVKFLVTQKGKAEDFEVIRGLGFGCDRAAIRAIKRAKFIPAKKEGKPIATHMSIPVMFRTTRM